MEKELLLYLDSHENQRSQLAKLHNSSSVGLRHRTVLALSEIAGP